MLEDIPYKIARVAVNKHIATEKWFPTIAEIRASALSVAGTGIPDPATAWAEVLAEVRRTGTYGVPEFSCDEIKMAVNSIGWRNICLSEKISIERAHFTRAYEVYETRAKEMAQLPPSVRQLISQAMGDRERKIQEIQKRKEGQYNALLMS